MAPIGSWNSPAYWQQYTEAILQDVIGNVVSAYMDDIEIHRQGTLKGHNFLVDAVHAEKTTPKPACDKYSFF